MNKIIYHINHYLLPVLIVCALLVQSSCKKDTGSGAPVITAIRNYVVSPGDSIVNKTGPGQWIVIVGHNLKGALQVYFDGVPSSFNEALFSDTSAAILLPAVIPFPSISTDKINTIRYVTTHGETTFNVNIIPPVPAITSISNENANAGDSVTIYGLNFFFIQGINFAGINIPVANVANDGTFIRFLLPVLTQSGPVSVTTKSGTATTIYNVNDVNTGVFCNFDNINVYSWGATSVGNSAILFPGNRANYARISFATCPVGDWGYYNGGRSIYMNAGQWVPVDKVNDLIATWSLKFEVFVKNPWSSGTIFIHDGSFVRTCRFEPWKTAIGGVYQTTGWTTITIPMTEFRTKVNNADGTGVSAISIADLIGASGNKAMRFNFANPTVAVSNFDIAIDNIRIVKNQ